MGEEKIVMGFRVIEGGRAGGSTVYALKKAHAWHRGEDSELARWCTDPYPPALILATTTANAATVAQHDRDPRAKSREADCLRARAKTQPTKSQSCGW